MTKQTFQGISGEESLNKILQDNKYTSVNANTTSLGFFQEVLYTEQGIFKVTVPQALNGGGSNFFGTLEQITREEALNLTC